MRFQILVLILSCYQIFAYSQRVQTIDKLGSKIPTSMAEDTAAINRLNTKAFEVHITYPDSAIYLGKSALEYSQIVNYALGECKSLNNIGSGWLVKGNADSAIAYYNKSLLVADKSGQLDMIAKINTNKGLAQLSRGEHAYASKLMQESLEYYVSENDQESMAKVLTNIGAIYFNQSDFDKALNYFNESYTIQKMLDDREDMVKSLNNIGLINFSLGKYNLAIDHYLKAVSIIEKLPNENYSYVYSNLANLYLEMSQLNKALEYYRISYEHDIRNQNQNGQLNQLINIATTFQLLGDLDNATEFNIRALNILKSHVKICDKWSVLPNLSWIKLNQNQLDSAEYYAQWGAKQGDVCGDVLIRAESLAALSQVQWQRNELSDAKLAAKEAYNIADKIGSQKLIQRTSQTLSKIYETGRDFEQALKYHKIHSAVSDSLFNKETTQRIARLESQYEFDKEKELLISDHEKEELILQKEIDKRQIMLIFSVTCAILFLVLFFNFFLSNRRKRRDNTLIMLQKQRLEELHMFKEGLTNMIAHDIKNSLSTIIGISSKLENEFSEKIAHAGRMILQLIMNMLDVEKFEHAKPVLSLRKVKVTNMLAEAQLATELLLQDKSLRLSVELDKDFELEVDRDLIIRVFINLLSNAIKFSPANSTITIASSHLVKGDSHKLKMSFIDTGRGIHPDDISNVFDSFWYGKRQGLGQASSTGLGLTFCKMALEAHGGGIYVDSEYKKGSTFTIELPILGTKDLGDIVTDPNLEQNLKFNPNDLEKLKIYSDSFKKLKVHHVSAIMKILDELEALNLDSPWLGEMKTAIYYSDNEKYEELVEMLE